MPFACGAIRSMAPRARPLTLCKPSPPPPPRRQPPMRRYECAHSIQIILAAPLTVRALSAVWFKAASFRSATGNVNPFVQIKWNAPNHNGE